MLRLVFRCGRWRRILEARWRRILEASWRDVMANESAIGEWGWKEDERRELFVPCDLRIERGSSILDREGLGGVPDLVKVVLGRNARVAAIIERARVVDAAIEEASAALGAIMLARAHHRWGEAVNQAARLGGKARKIARESQCLLSDYGEPDEHG